MPRVILVGDAAQDIYHQPLLPREYSPEEAQTAENWALQARWKQHVLPGGMRLLQSMCEMLEMDSEVVPANGPEIRSFATLGEYVRRADGSRKRVWRVREFGGYCGPEESTSMQTDMVGKGDSPVDALILDDAGNGARWRRDEWKHLFEPDRLPRLIVHKMSMPLAQGDLWQNVLKADERTQRVLVINAEDLRNEGTDLSRRLSWDRTVENLCEVCNQKVGVIANLLRTEWLVVRFDCDAACLIERGGRARLVFDPGAAEGDFDAVEPGTMPGKMSSFVAELARTALAKEASEEEDFAEAVKEALARSRAVATSAFKEDESGSLRYPNISKLKRRKEGLRSLEVKLGQGSTALGMPRSREHALSLAKDFIYRGEEAIAEIPHARFGKLLSVYREEIEGFRAIADLLRRHVGRRGSKPISLAVFGPPGSGKSFGVEEVVSQVLGTRTPPFTFNLSLLEDADDLAGAFQEIRDASLSGEPPLCFFDEFDIDGFKYVASFLAPMQDGTFRDGPRFHPIGPAIFVFAGGTLHSCKDLREKANCGVGETQKLPDFISRLSGFIDVLGPNPQDGEFETGGHLVCRAILLRSFLMQMAPALFSPVEKRISIDPAVLRAFLKVKEFTFGARSIKAILRMSRIDAQSTHFAIADLPHREQLALHVDPEEFENKLGVQAD